jgi:hypothetical protein
MMAVIRRLLGLEESPEEIRARERAQQFEDVKDGLHDAARRVHFLEMESELRARGILPKRETERDRDP